MAQDSFKAMVLTQEDEETRHEIQDLTTEDLPEEGDVLVSVEYSSLNYKDAMAVTGTGKISGRRSLKLRRALTSCAATG